MLLIVLTACARGATVSTSPSEVAGAATSTTTGPGFVPQPYEPTITIPSELNLSGKLIFSDYRVGIAQLDFTTMEIVPIYLPPEYGYVNSAVLSPDGQTLLLAYTPPPDLNNPNSVSSSLYTLPADGSQDPQTLFEDSGNRIYYFSPWWSPDGRSIYYGRYIYPANQGTPASEQVGYFLTRYALPDGPAQDLLTDVLTVRISADGKRLFYISMNPATALSNLYASDADGATATSLLPGGESWIIDSLAVAPDGESVVFSSASDGPVESSSSWWDRLMGVSVAQAHNLPTDLWIVKIGEDPQQITHLADYGFFMAYSPDGQYIVFACSSGVFIIRPDGSELTQIISDPFSGSLQWVP
jgi:Tol biopolymer transport system component